MAEEINQQTQQQQLQQPEPPTQSVDELVKLVADQQKLMDEMKLELQSYKDERAQTQQETEQLKKELDETKKMNYTLARSANFAGRSEESLESKLDKLMNPQFYNNQGGK